MSYQYQSSLKTPMNTITIKGANEHNLKNISIKIPRNKLVVVSGLSGSGKSSLVYDTIFREGQRRYVESLSTYARQFLGILEKPKVESIEGLTPTIAINQKTISKNPRSTVGTITEIYDYLRLLFSRIGIPYCPNCKTEISNLSRSNIIKKVNQIISANLKSNIYILAPILIGKNTDQRKLISNIKKTGYVKVRINDRIYDIDKVSDGIKTKSINIVVDRILSENVLDKNRITSSLVSALELGNGVVLLSVIKNKKKQSNFIDSVYSEKYVCQKCGFCFENIDPRMFSFNNPAGACQFCHGLGYKKEISEDLIVPNKNLTIAEGAIRPWTKMCSHMNLYNGLLESIAKSHGGSIIDTPIKNLSAKDKKLVFYGEQKKPDEQGVFEGVIPYLLKRYYSTNSMYIKNEIEKYMTETTCTSCQGKRLKPENLSIIIDDKSISDISDMTIDSLADYFKKFLNKLSESKKRIAKPIAKEVLEILNSLQNVSLGYLNLSRSSSTLAGGEAQRIRLAIQISSGLIGITYILDEPSIGLHPKDISHLLKTLKKLRDLGNSVIIVEHDKEVINSADYLIDIGPGAGENGGKIIAFGTPKQVMQNKRSITGKYLIGKNKILIPELYRKTNNMFLEIKNIKKHNLKNIDVRFPIGTLVGISGVSGSGKSTLVVDVLAKSLKQQLFNRNKTLSDNVKPLLSYPKVKGIKHIDKVINIDQAPIGRSSRSNAATYVGFFTAIREIFAQTSEARIRNYNSGSFSFNVKGGRCETCQGEGQIKIEMKFLPDVYVTCQDCQGKRYNKDVLEITYHGKNINSVLDLSVKKALTFFNDQIAIKEKLKVLDAVGLGYLRLGQPAPELSGGEAQRIKLASELIHKSTGKTLYILDEPTTGLHFEDIKKLLVVINKLVDAGNTVIVIEHNMDVLKCCDWIIDLGPEGGDKGGYLVASGTPENIACVKKSYTGQYLKKEL